MVPTETQNKGQIHHSAFPSADACDSGFSERELSSWSVFKALRLSSVSIAPVATFFFVVVTGLLVVIVEALVDITVNVKGIIGVSVVSSLESKIKFSSITFSSLLRESFPSSVVFGNSVDVWTSGSSVSVLWALSMFPWRSKGSKVLVRPDRSSNESIWSICTGSSEHKTPLSSLNLF